MSQKIRVYEDFKREKHLFDGIFHGFIRDADGDPTTIVEDKDGFLDLYYIGNTQFLKSMEEELNTKKVAVYKTTEQKDEDLLYVAKFIKWEKWKNMI